MLERFRRRVREHNPFVMELMSGLGVAGWGLFSTIDPRPLSIVGSYQILATMPDAFWEVWAMATGTIQALAAVLERRSWRMVGAWSALLWCSVVGNAIRNGPEPSGGVMIYVALCGGAIWSLLHLHSTRRAGRGAR